MTEPQFIRNFCIVAHIDHGKSTLSDRLLEKAKVVDERTFHAQMTDNMDIERERGITIKSQAVTIPYTARDGSKYMLNFVDTPGHVDFTYEVSRAIAACEGALLVIDASQGVESQTLSNLYLALEHNLEIIPVINKIDLPAADVPGTLKQIEKDLGLDPQTAVCVSAKTGEGIDELLEAIVAIIPQPSLPSIKEENAKKAGEAQGETLQARIFDSHYDPYRGVIVHVRVFSGSVRAGDTVRFMNSRADYKVEETGIFI